MIIKKYIKGGLNSDTSQSLVPDGDYLNALNIRGQVGDDGRAGVIRPVPGHTKVANIANDWASNLDISTQDVKHICVDDINGYAYAFVSGTVVKPSPALPVPPKILRIDLKNGSVTTIITGDNISDNWEPDNDSTYLWDDLVEAKIVGDAIIWINKYGQQFSLNIKSYVEDQDFLSQNVDRRDISLIKAPPAINITAFKIEDQSYSGPNFIKDNVFQFAYRYIYLGFEQSVVSPWSPELPYNGDLDDFNAVRISVPLLEKLPQSILHIDIICKNNTTGAINLIKRFSTTEANTKSLMIEHNTTALSPTLNYTFYNNSIYEAIDQAYFLKQFDNIPVTSKSLEISKDRLFLSNNVEGYDAPVYENITISAFNGVITDVRDINYSLQTYDVKVHNYALSPANTIVDTYYYWRNIMFIDGIPQAGWYFVPGDFGPGAVGTKYTSDDISITPSVPAYPNIVEIQQSALNLLTNTYLKKGCEIYIKGFANANNNGFYVIESVSTTIITAVKSNIANTNLAINTNAPVVEAAGQDVSITLMSSFYSRLLSEKSLIPDPIDDVYEDLVYIGPQPDTTPTERYFINRSFVVYPVADYVTYTGPSINNKLSANQNISTGGSNIIYYGNFPLLGDFSVDQGGAGQTQFIYNGLTAFKPTINFTSDSVNFTTFVNQPINIKYVMGVIKNNVTTRYGINGNNSLTSYDYTIPKEQLTYDAATSASMVFNGNQLTLNAGLPVGSFGIQFGSQITITNAGANNGTYNVISNTGINYQNVTISGTFPLNTTDSDAIMTYFPQQRTDTFLDAPSFNRNGQTINVDVEPGTRIFFETYSDGTLISVSRVGQSVLIESRVGQVVPYVPSRDVSISNLPSSQTRSFKTGCRYNVGIQFYDFAMRKCGVVAKSLGPGNSIIDLAVSIPDRTYSTLENYAISWSLPTNSLQIPTWAKYYSLVRTDNLDTRYFIQSSALGTQIRYVKRDAATKAFDIETFYTTYSFETAGVAIDLETMINDGFGYIYEESNNDIVKLYRNLADTQTLKVIGQQGRYIILEPKEINGGSALPTSSTEYWKFEIRTPYKQTGSEFFFEDHVYPINDWGTSQRDYSVKSGLLIGDTFRFSNIEYMNLRKEFRNVWNRNLGRSCFIDPVGQVYRPSGVRWSNVFIPGSKVNGLSTFDALDYKDLPVELGPVNKLKTTSKAQSDGNIMLAIGQNYTASLYIGETSLVDNAGQTLLTTSGSVVGTVNILKGKFGTTIPSSVVEYDGNVYWADILNECIVRYSANGLFAISDYGMRNFFRSYFKAKKASVDEFDIAQSQYIYGGYNPATDEYILSFTPVSQSPDLYPDSSASRHSDIKTMYKSGTPAKSVAFSLSQERWTSFYSHSGPYMYFGGKMYSFVKSEYPTGPTPTTTPIVSGGLFEFDKDSAINNFSGFTKDSFISIPYNDAPNNIKIFQAVCIEGDATPTTTYVETFTPNNQVTNMVSSDFVNREDMLYSEIYRDRVSPNVSGTADEKMYTGDKMRGQYANMSLVWGNPSNFAIRFINVNVKDSIGHNKLSQ